MHHRSRSPVVRRIVEMVRPDPLLAPIMEWLEIEQGEARRRAVARTLHVAVRVLLFVLGCLLTACLLLAVAPRMFGSTESVVILAALCGAAGYSLASVGGDSIARRVAVRNPHDRSVRAAINEIERHAFWRRLRWKLGDGGASALSDGATLYLRCRTALMGEAWSAESGNDAWTEARNDLLRAVEHAMGRLALLVVKRRTFEEVTDLLEQLRQAANEAERATTARALGGLSSSRDIRGAVARLRELTEAESEIERALH